MKKLHTGIILFDAIDIICISFFAGSSAAYLFKKHRKYKIRKVEDPIVAELKEKSPAVMLSEDRKPLKLPSLRGGSKENLTLLSILIKSKRLAKIVRSIVTAKKNQNQLRLLRVFFFAFNGFYVND